MGVLTVCAVVGYRLVSSAGNSSRHRIVFVAFDRALGYPVRIYVFGVVAYRKHPLLWPVFLLLTPLAVVLHSVGAFWGVVSPVENFEVTEKVTADTIEQTNKLDEGALAEHEGTDRLLRESDEEFEEGIFTDD